MIVAVTDIRKLAPATPAIEYEIRKDDGTVLAFDYFHFRLKLGEGKLDAIGLARAYLRLRCLKWALSTTADLIAKRKETKVGSRLPPNLPTFDAFPVTAGDIASWQFDPTQAAAERLVTWLDKQGVTHTDYAFEV